MARLGPPKAMKAQFGGHVESITYPASSGERLPLAVATLPQGRELMRTIGLIAAAVLLAACSEAPRRAEVAPKAPVAVTVVAATLQDTPAVYEATGTVRARATAVISSKVMGYVRQVAVQAGDRVREGQALITLDARDLDTAHRRAQAGVAEVRSAIPEADSGVAAAKAQQDLAEATYRRIDELAGKNSVSRQELDEAAARRSAARAGYEMARARRTQLDSKMAQAEQEVRAAAIMRDYAQIAAPIAGVVTSRTVDPGSLATPGTPLLTIEREGAYRLEANVEETRLAAVRAGEAVEVVLDALGRTLQGKVAEIMPAVDAGSRSYTVKIDLGGGTALRSGMFGRARFPLGRKRALTVPAAAVAERGQLRSVYVVEDGAAHTRLITVGSRIGDTVEVLSGLEAGEKVVAPAPAALADGARVEVRQ
jgi:RND family efflux transporter MFP subunit